MSVHYKFKSALEYDTVTFDGLHISVKDLKNAIIQQKRIGKSTDFDLQVTNAQTKEVYEDENVLIPKNTSLLIARIPTMAPKAKQWEGYGGENTPPSKIDEGGPIAKAVDLSSLDAPEDDKIKAMMSQSTQDYDPSNYIKIRGANQIGTVPPNYRCYKCHQGGHWIKDCTFGQGPDPIEIKKSTGIPRSFMVPVEGPQVPGAMMTPNGSYAVPVLDHQAYNQKPTPAPLIQDPKPEIPEDLLCNICSDLLTDAVMIPCCGNSFCDECIRFILLESEDHECPDCHEKEISPGTLIPNRFLRKSVANFKNTTGYVKKPVYREKLEPRPTETADLNNKKESTPPQEPESTEKPKSDAEEKTVISEADSTEHAKDEQNADPAKEVEPSEPAKLTESESIPEGPPGVSPRSSPREQHIHRVNSSREPRERSNRHHKHKGDSPRKNTRHRRSPNYSDSGSREERSGTPTIDEPTGSGSYNPTNAAYNSSAPPGTIPSMIGNIPSMQGPPQSIPPGFPPGQPPLTPFPPTQGPLPNFRLPPPGTAPPPYLPPGPYVVPPRPMFEPNRPPMGGPPPAYANFPPGARGHRDYGRRIRDRTPPGLIDDPLAAFNKMIREKDERERRIKQRNLRRSYSRSRSRSRSYSRSPVRRRSRSPRPIRRSRSRSRSFSLSRSRSRSYSGSLRGSPYRQLSPTRRSPLPPRRGPSRYRSPIRSPPRNRHQTDRHRERDYDDDRDYGRDDRPFKDARRPRDVRDRRSRDRERDRDPRDRERDRYYDNYDDRRGPPRPQQWPQQNMPPRPMQDTYYPPPDIQAGYQANRYPAVPSRDYGPPFMNKEPPFNQPLPQTIHSIQPQRHYDDIAPPGVDDDIAPPGVEEPPPFKHVPAEHKEKEGSPKNVDKDDKRSVDRKDRERSNDRKRSRHEKRSRTPDKARNPSPKRKSKSKERDSPDKHRRRRRDSSDREEKDRRRDHSDDERSRRGKDKKKHKEKKDSDKRRKRDKKERHKKDTKEKKPKEEFKQVIPKNIEESDEDVSNKLRSDEKKTEEMEEERKLEEKRLEALKEDKRQEVSKEEQKLDSDNRKKEEDRRAAAQEDEHSRKTPEERRKSPELEEAKPDLYEDMLSEEIDTNVMENYGKLEENNSFEDQLDEERREAEDITEEGEIKEFEDEEKDVLELHSTDLDLKAEVDKTDILAPVPEKSKWEVEEDGQMAASPKDSLKSDSKSDKSGKVTTEVLKRAENAIFAKAINAIRPIEIKKISTDRAKLYSGEREVEKNHNQLQVTVASAGVDPKKDSVQAPARVSVKERLGIKVEDNDRVINLARNRSRTISPFSRRGESGRNYAMGERRVEIDEVRTHRDRNKRSRSRRRETSRDRHRNRTDSRHHNRHDHRRNDRKRDTTRKDDRGRHEDEKKTKKKRSRSRSESEDRKDKHKKKDKKQKKDKLKKEDAKEDKEDKEVEPKPQPAAAKRKPTIDEANFEPDYDLESHTEEEDEKEKKKDVKKQPDKEGDDKKTSSSESDSDSSSEDERRKKKHKKHKKKKKRETSSSSSDSESESSDSERDRKRRKHKKNKKKKKKSKHK